MQASFFPGVERLLCLRVGSALTRASAVLALVAALPASGSAQQTPDRSRALPTFAVYGDLDIERGGPEKGRLRLALEDRFGRIVRSLVVTNRFEFRFADLPVGEYTLVLRDGLRELGRVAVPNENLSRSEVRLDLAIRAPTDTAEARMGNRGAITFARPARHQELWESAATMAGQGRWDGVLRILDEISSENPADFEAWSEQGAAYYRLEQWDEAEAAWVRAARERPDYFPPWFNLGKLRFGRGDHAGAIEALTEAVRLRPSSAPARYYLGESYLAVQLGSKAVPHLEEAIRLDPQGMAEVHVRLAALYDGAGYPARAAEEYRRYLEKRPRAKNRKAIRRYIERQQVKP